MRFHVYLVHGEHETLRDTCDNVDEAILVSATNLWPELEANILQDFIRFSELLKRTEFYFNNDFKSTDYYSPDPKRTYREAMQLKQKLLDHLKGELKFPPIEMQNAEKLLENIQELCIKLKGK